MDGEPAGLPKIIKTKIGTMVASGGRMEAKYGVSRKELLQVHVRCVG